MKVRIIKTPSFAGGGLYDGGYQLSPGETQAMIAGYTNAAKNVAGAVKSFGDAASPAAAMIRDTVQGALTGNSSGGSGSLTSALGTASQLSSLAGSAGAAGTAAGATGAAAGAAGAGAAAAGAAGGAAGLAGLASSLAPLAALASDKRVKENIEKVGKTFDGQNIYRFNYKGDPHTQLGLIAQEVEKTGNADSVYNVNGIKMVDYNNATEDAAQKGKFMNGGNYRKRLSSTMTYAEGGTATDPQLLQAYRTIANELSMGQDPNELIGQFTENGMNYDDARGIVADVMDFMDPTSEAQMPQAQMGGMNNGMFAGQSMQPNIIEKPLMKDGGQTFVTSQPAYTKKSHTYFGTSNAPARDSYTDNNQVTTSVKAVPREDATIEAEKGEYIFNPQGLYKILGKKHSEGGTPLAAKGGEFIFSAHRDMSIDPELQKEANLKIGSSKALAENTPSKILERNIDTKEYNRLKSIVNDPKHDAITKKTAQFMLEKMDNKIQVIAKLQEAKKQPNPVEIKDQVLEQPQIQEDVNEQKQFAYGGINLPAYQSGNTVVDPKVAANYTKPFQSVNYFSNATSTTPTTTVGTAPVTTTSTSQAATAPATTTTTAPASTTSTPTTTTPGNNAIFSGVESDPNSERSKQQAIQYESALRRAGYTGPSMLNLDYSTTHPEIGEAQKYAAGKFGPQIADYLRTQKPSVAMLSMLHGRDIKDKTAVTDQELLSAYPDQYWSWRGFVPSETKPDENPHDMSVVEKDKDQDKDMDLGTKPIPRLPGRDTFNIHDPYNKVRAMQASQYLSNVVANKPYFTYAAPVNAPLLEAQKMSSQPFMDEAAKARYSANELASKFGSPVQAMIAAAQQNDAVNKGLFEVNKYNTEAETQNRNQNLLRTAAAANTWNDRMKQTYDQNANVLDKMNYANAAYYNQYSSARQKDMLEKYYKLRQEKMNLLSSVEAQPRVDKFGRVFNDMVFPINESGEINPSWNGWNTNLVNSLTDDKNSGLDALQKELTSTNLSDQQKNEIIANYFTNKYGKSKTSK